MSKKSITELKAYFKAGKRPTENQFSDLLDSYAHLDDSGLFTESYKYKDFFIFFPHQQNDLAVDILLGNGFVNGNFEIQIVGSYSNENTIGVLRKQIVFGGNPDNNIWNPSTSRIMEASGPIVDHIYIGDIVWDSTLNQYKLSINHTRSTGNPYSIRIVQQSQGTAVVDNAKVSGIYNNPITGQNKHYVHYNDNTGIGISLPETSLHVRAPKNQGHSNVTGALFDRSEAAGGSNIVQLRYHSTADLELNSFYTGTNFRYGSYGDFNIVNNINEGVHGAINFVTNSTVRLCVHPSGNIGIGTMNPDQKLTVKGKIHAEDVIVDMNVPADYVFQKYYDNYSPIRTDYHMPDLQELESYIKENKHLPEIPSGETMIKDGVKIGDFQMKLLQKIEELTLYMISQNKEIEQLKTLIN